MCTRVLWNTNKLAVLTGRTMDWPEITEPKIVVFPRGMSRRGAMLGDQTVVPENPLNWESKYGSIVTTIYGVGSVDGMNEKSLAAHMLYLKATDVGERDTAKPGLQIGLWAQYLLDNTATVQEAVDLLDTFQPVMVEVRGFKATVHLAIEDASGDSAIIEYVNGERKVHHDKQYTLMTNDPPYDEQLALLKSRDFSKPSRDLPIPGNVNAQDRFQRAAYFAALLPEPKDERQAVAGIMAIMRNVSVPFGAPYGEFGIYNTEYRTVCDLTNRRYFFELTTSPNVIWIELDKFDLSAGAPVLMVNPYDYSLNGNVSDKFTAVEPPF